MELDSFILRIKNLDAKDLILKSVSSRTEELADYNVLNMDKGLLSTGVKITPDYSAGYAEFKGFKTPNLELEGDFKHGVYVKIEGDKIAFGSTDWKESKLVMNYSDDIFGTTTNELIEIADMDMVKTIDNELTR